MTRNIDPLTGLGYNNKQGYLRGTWEYNRNHSLRRYYKIDLTEWYAIFKNQGNVCAICGGDDPRGKNWHTDHNHVTGKVRGILCGCCNTALGKFNEDKKLLEKAALYLDHHE